MTTFRPTEHAARREVPTRYLTVEVPFTGSIPVAGTVTVTIAVPADEWIEDDEFLSAADDVLNAAGPGGRYVGDWRGEADAVWGEWRLAEDPTGEAEDFVPTGEVTVTGSVVSG